MHSRPQYSVGVVQLTPFALRSLVCRPPHTMLPPAVSAKLDELDYRLTHLVQLSSTAMFAPSVCTEPPLRHACPVHGSFRFFSGHLLVHFMLIRRSTVLLGVLKLKPCLGMAPSSSRCFCVCAFGDSTVYRVHNGPDSLCEHSSSRGTKDQSSHVMCSCGHRAA
jgi:hypothetical protein